MRRLKRKTVYVGLCVLVGVLLQFILHALAEMWYISLLLEDFGRYGLGLSWEAWFRIHGALSVALLCAGVWGGYAKGVYWWKRGYGH